MIIFSMKIKLKRRSIKKQTKKKTILDVSGIWIVFVL